jgi:hypothetical protein
MPAIIDPQEPERTDAPLWRKLLWFMGIAVASSAATLALAYALRLLLFLK